MCGITGAIWTESRLAVDALTLARMTAALRHRGPDAEGEYLTEYRLREAYEPMPGVALGHRRLSIIDVAGGKQPMCNEDGTIWLIFNGEIYNFPALRRRLEGSGHKFQTDSDTETVVHLYEDEGTDCFTHLNGMFAVAIWDTRRRRLVLGRDRLGVKPLVYRHEPGRLSFASELKSLLQMPGAPREIDPAAIDEYLTYQYVPHPNTILRGYRKLPPGHFAVWHDDRLDVRPYWQPDFNVESPISEHEASERLRELFTDAVKIRLRSDVPLGAFLSGGVDSSLVAAVMQQLSSAPIKTFNIAFPVKEYDESRFARQVANHLQTDHHELEVSPSALEVLPQLAHYYDEPFGDSSAIPTWYVSKLTREHVSVALSGDGGDESFAGYQRYKAVALAGMFDRVPAIRALFASRLWQAAPSSSRQKSRVRRFKRFCEALAASPERRYLDWISIFNETRRAELYSDDFLSRLPDSDPAMFLISGWRRAKSRDAVTKACVADLTTYLPCDILTKVDIASMAHGLEVRGPFLDYRLAEFAAALPLHLRYRRGKGKRILRAAFGDLLPAEIWNRAKMGFGVPLDHWLRGELRPLVRDLLLDSTALGRGYFRGGAVERLVAEHEKCVFDHSARLWALIMLELWHREWIDAGSAPLQRATAVG
jgi:asparagine synthase (glutamine-hydrolysing)